MVAPPGDFSVCDLLLREDKHYLGSGDGLIYAPPWPLWLDRPGFWDGVHYFLFSFRPAFTITLVDSLGRECPLHPVSRVWTPAELAVRYRADALELSEQRLVLAGGRLLSVCSLANHGHTPAHVSLVAWTAQEGRDLRDRAAIVGGVDDVRFRVVTHDAQLRGLELDLDATLSIADSHGSCIAETQHMAAYPNPPLWSITPFPEHWLGGHLDGTVRHALEVPDSERTLLYCGVSRRLEVEPGDTVEAEVLLELQPVQSQLRLPAPPRPAAGEAVRASRAAWSDYFAAAPALTCSDPWLDRYFAYRWYGLRLNFLDPAGDYRHPTVAEGIDHFHAPVSYSAAAHVRELRWLSDPHRARGVMRCFLQRQRPDGSLPGILYLRGEHPSASYLADWGGSLEALEEVHPDPRFLAECYQPLARFAAYMSEQRDADHTGMYDIRDPHETGQETMSRYTAVDHTAGRHHFSHHLRLKGIDVTVYMYRLHRALARAAAMLGSPHEARLHDEHADRIAAAVRAHMWDGTSGLFSDVDPDTGRPTGIRAAVCFYPYLTDIAGPEHIQGINRHLLDETSFWLPYPVPSTAADDPSFSADGEWQGVRQNRGWNGRVWPMTNSHMVEALGVASALDPVLRGRAVDLFTSYLRMLFLDGDPARPSSYEHYSPHTGQPARYRGIDDYQHSWVNDLIVRYVAGIRPEPTGLVVDPFPFDIEYLRLERLPFRGHAITIELDGPALRGSVAGNSFESPRDQPLHIAVP